MARDPDELPGARGVVPERITESVVDHVQVASVRRQADEGEVRPIAWLLHLDRVGPASASVGGQLDQGVLVVESSRAVGPAQRHLVRCARTCRFAVRDLQAREGAGPGAGDSIKRDRPNAVEGADVGDVRDHLRLVPLVSAVGRARHQEDGALLDVLPDGVDVALAVRANRAALPARLLPICERRAQRRRPRPGVAAVRGVADPDLLRADVLLTPELRVADVRRAETGARRGGVDRDVLLVGERRRALAPLGDDGGIAPRARVVRSRGGQVIGVGDRDRLEALERRVTAFRGEVRGQVGVVEPRSVRPAEVAIRIRARTEDRDRIAIGDQSGLVVVRQRADRTYSRGAGSIAPALIGRLAPARTPVEGEVDARIPDTLNERAVPAHARSLIDLVVRAGGQHVRMDWVDRDRGLVLLVLREWRRWASRVDECLGRRKGSSGRDTQGEGYNGNGEPASLQHSNLLYRFTSPRRRPYRRGQGPSGTNWPNRPTQ